MNIEKIKKLAAQFYPELVEIRRYLHAHPELSFKEFDTSEYIKSLLNSWKVKYTDNWVKTGIVAEIGNGDPVIALRADIDALPIIEQNNNSYCSKNHGIMHACGHDVHTTCLLGAIKILKNFESEIEGSIKFIFQPGEEKLPGGAKLMLEENALGEKLPQKIYGQHVFPDLEVGKVGFKAGMYMASCDELYFNVKGNGGHAALPGITKDTVLAASQLVVALKEIVSQTNNQNTPAVLAIGKFIAAGVTNIIPAEVQLEGTLRTFNENRRREIHNEIKEVAHKIAETHGVNCEVKIDIGYPFLKNDEYITALAKSAAKEYLGEENVIDLELRMTAEDFSYYSQLIPACFYRLGTRNENKGITSGLHTSTFDIDEEALKIGAGLMAWLAIGKL
ncbi:MAG: M20 family metallopeptidase [Flavobacteriales bacterium]